MGLVSSRLNLEGLNPSSRRRSQQEETLYNYTLDKNFFSNYFLMGGERFEVNDPDYLFGDNCDLNFLSCTKPHCLPYKKAQQNLLTHLNSKHKAIDKVSSRVGGLSSPFNILTGRHRQALQSRKQDAQTQTLNNAKSGLNNGLELSQPLRMFVSIRKETLRLVKTTPLSFDATSTLSSKSSTSTKSGYTSVKDVSPSECASDENDDEAYEDALNDTTNLSAKDDDDDDSEQTQQQKSLLRDTFNQTKENRDIKIIIANSREEDNERNEDTTSARNSSDIEDQPSTDKQQDNHIIERKHSSRKPSVMLSSDKRLQVENLHSTNPVYNIEFNFDSEIDCSIRIFYFCTREIGSNGITYKPKHATYKSKTYTYKKGLNQKFEQQEHTFQPYLFDEDLLIYKPLDLDGNYNSGAVFPIVIHCVALEGLMPRQSHSLIATVEKSQLDDSYSIRPLKQIIFVDGVQYILQDIYGIENRRLAASNESRRPARRFNGSNQNLRVSVDSLNSIERNGANLSREDTISLRSTDTSACDVQLRGSLTSNQYKSIGSENSFECVICMSEERDTMLLPCRHLCLCSSCAQSLRFQANSCPICRCPFKAALNLRVLQRYRAMVKDDLDCRRTSLSNSTTPLLSRPTNDVVLDIGGASATFDPVTSSACENGGLEMKSMRRIEQRRDEEEVRDGCRTPPEAD